MAVLLKHDDKDHGMVAIAEGVIAGEPHAARHYHHEGHFIEVEHQSQHVVDHDVEEMKKLGYHVASPPRTARTRKGAAQSTPDQGVTHGNASTAA